MVMIPEHPRRLSVGVDIQLDQFGRSVEEIINSLPFLVSEDIEVLLLIRHVADSFRFVRNPGERVAIEVRSDLETMDVWGNRHIVVSDSNLGIGGFIDSQICWIEVGALFPIFRFRSLRAYLWIVFTMMVRIRIYSIAIIRSIIILSVR